MRTFMGLEVIVTEHIVITPRMQCSDEFCRIQSPELVASTNRWMLEFFGMQRSVWKAGNKLFMHPDDWQKIQIAKSRNNYGTLFNDLFQI